MTSEFWLLVSILVIVICCLQRPSRLRCRADWYVSELHDDGRFACVPPPIGNPDYDGTWQRPERSTQPPGEIRGRIYCTGGTCPVVVDSQIVSCQHVAGACRQGLSQ